MTTHLYRHFDEDDNLLYVGISLSAYNRLSQHKRNSEWAKEAVKMTTESFKSREDALLAESIAIKSEKPKYNKMHSNNKEFVPFDFNRSILALNKNALILLLVLMKNNDCVIVRSKKNIEQTEQRTCFIHAIKDLLSEGFLIQDSDNTFKLIDM